MKVSRDTYVAIAQAVASVAGGSIPDGDKGDITVTSGVWTIDAGTVSTSKLGGDITTAGKALLDDVDAAAQRTTLGLGTAAIAQSSAFAPADVWLTKNDMGTLALASDQQLIRFKRLALSSANRLTLAGTAKAYLYEYGTVSPIILGFPKSPDLSFLIPNNYFFDQLTRLSLANNVRATLEGTADLLITDDLKTRSRLTLTGRG